MPQTITPYNLNYCNTLESGWVHIIDTKVSETRIFQPKHAVNYYHDLSEKIQTGDLKFVAKPLILRGVERLSELATKYSNQQTVSAVQYGDVHMRNLIFDGTCLSETNISRN